MHPQPFEPAPRGRVPCTATGAMQPWPAPQPLGLAGDCETIQGLYLYEIAELEAMIPAKAVEGIAPDRSGLDAWLLGRCAGGGAQQ
jgi:hypothetical protein